MDLAFITSLPPAAQAVFVLALGAVYGLVHFGILSGRRAASAPKAAPGASEIVAITVDSRAIEKLAGEVAGLSVALTESAAATKQMASAGRELARNVDGLMEELRDTNVELRVTREVAKAKAS